MKTSSKQLKLQARRALLGNYGTAIGAELVFLLLVYGIMIVLFFIGIASSITGFTIDDMVGEGLFLGFSILMYVVIYFVTLLLAPGMLRFHLNLCKEGKAKVSDLFFAFKNHMGKFIGVTVGIIVIAVVFMIPLFVVTPAAAVSTNPGFLVTFSSLYMIFLWILMLYVSLTYGMFYLIITEDPEKGIREALSESRMLMKGNRGRYFWLWLSFIGWFLLAGLSYGLAMIWIYPFIIAANVMFYLDLKPETERNASQWQPDLEGVQPGNMQMNYAQAGYSQPGYQQAGDAQTGYSQPVYQQAGDVQTGYSQPGYQQAGDVQTDSVQPGYQQAEDAQTGSMKPGYSQAEPSQTGFAQEEYIRERENTDR